MAESYKIDVDNVNTQKYLTFSDVDTVYIYCSRRDS